MKTLRQVACAAFAGGALFTLQSEARAAYYPNTSNGTFVSRLRVEYPGLVGGSTPHTPQNGYFKFKNGSTDYYGGGWILVEDRSDTPQAAASFSDDTVTFRQEITEISTLLACVPQSLRNQIHIQVTVIRSPYALGSSPSITDTQTATTTLGALESQSLRWDPGFDLRWIDQRLTLRWELWLDSSICDPITPGRFTREFSLQTTRTSLSQLSPFLVPVGLIGQPPGNLSWSRMTLASGAGAGLGVTDTQSMSTSVQDSYGIGPFTHSDPEVTTTRTQTRGTQTTFSVQTALNFATHPVGQTAPYGPGEGDLMFCLLRPSFELFRTTADSDFKLLRPNAGYAFAYFPMRDLLQPQPGTPWASLTPAENAKFRELDPLLSDPRAPLSEPRYYKVLGPVIGTTGQLGGQFSTSTLTRAEVNNAVGSSTLTNNSTSFSLPLGAIGSAIGLPLPVPDPFVRHTETTTSSVEYRTTDIEQAEATILTEFSIADSDPRKVLMYEVYYDTMFHSFAFRDASPPPLVFEQVRMQWHLDETRLLQWRSLREDWTRDRSGYLVAGSLKDWAPEGGMATFQLADGKEPPRCAMIDSRTGNLVMAGLKPGKYWVTVYKQPKQGPKSIREWLALPRAAVLAFAISKEGVPTLTP